MTEDKYMHIFPMGKSGTGKSKLIDDFWHQDRLCPISKGLIGREKKQETSVAEAVKPVKKTKG